MGIIFSEVRKIVSAGLSFAPTLGMLLGGLSEVLWPDDTEEVWDQIKGEVQESIHQSIADSYYRSLRDDLRGIHNLLVNYLRVVPTGRREDIQPRLEDLIARCAGDMPRFQRTEYALALLPLFAQLGNIHLGGLRDLGRNARNWGDPELVAVNLREFADYLGRYSGWVTAQYTAGRSRVPRVAKDPHKTVNWNALNRYDRTLQLMVLDFQALWPSFKPDGSIPVPRLTREVYSDALGTSDETPLQTSTNSDLASSDVPLTELTAWATREYAIGHPGRTVDGIQPSYGRSVGKLMGSTDRSSGKNVFDLGVSYPVVGVFAMSGDLFNSFEFLYQDGSRSGPFPFNPIPGGKSFWGFDGHFLSSMTVMGISAFYAKKGVPAANCAVIGFRPLDSYTSPPQKPLVFPQFTRVSATTQTARPLYALFRTGKEGYLFDYLTSMVQCGARMADGFSLTETHPVVFLLPDNSLYPDAVPVYRMTSRDKPERVTITFSLPSYQAQQQEGWVGSGVLGYLLKNTSPAPAVTGSQVVTVPVYVLRTKSQTRTMLAWAEAEYQSQLREGWSDAGWPKPVGYALRAL